MARPSASILSAAPVAESGQNGDLRDGGADDLSRLRAVAARAALAGGECAPLPQPLARSARPRRAGSIGADEAVQRIPSWIAHAEHADTWRFRHALFRGIPFDPARGPPFRGGPYCPKRRLAGHVTPLRGARRLLEQQLEELPVRLPQQQPHCGTTMSGSGWPYSRMQRLLGPYCPCHGR